MVRMIKHTYFAVMTNPACLRAIFAVFVVGLVVMSTSAPGFAANDFADMGQNLEAQSKGIAGAAQMIFYLLGFVLVGVGLVMLAMSNSRGTAVAMLCIGFALTSIGVVISMGSSSFFGSDVSEVDNLFN